MHTVKSSSKAVAGSPSRAVLTLPNALSLGRLATVPLFLWLFVSEREDEAVVVYGAGAVTDLLDGYIARRTGSVSELGKLLDPLADRVLIAALAVALMARGALPRRLALAVVGRDVLLLGLWPWFERRGLARIPVNLLGKTATASLLVGLTWVAVAQTSYARWAGGRGGLVLAGVGGILYWAAAAGYARAALAGLRAQARDDVAR